MRNVLNISAVLACGLLAGVCGLIQGEPTRAASLSASTVVAGDAAVRMPDALLVPIRKTGGVEAHFAAANTTHDGHLTHEQALQGDWSRVAKHFDEIDTEHKGWITVEQIHAFNKGHSHHRKDQTPA